MSILDGLTKSDAKSFFAHTSVNAIFRCIQVGSIVKFGSGYSCHKYWILGSYKRVNPNK
jgi:hypothetical protein